ncbi:PH domain-containing protein [Jannaschia sp. R86511]|uniref:PH domain-containing protein n=1 Tax=Jannaschia sp. R86511 TaxID=3093853 RepID=UPI0036D3CE48
MTERKNRRQELHRPIRPRAGRWVPLVLAAVWLLVFGALAAGYPPYPGIGTGDRVGFTLVALVGAWVLYRFGSVALLPDEDGLVVRNVLGRRRLTWAEVVGVRYGRDSTWAHLDLSDGTNVAALGVQTADGAWAQASAVRLATLVELHARELGGQDPDRG